MRPTCRYIPFDYAAAVVYCAGHGQSAIAVNEVDLYFNQNQRDAWVVIVGGRQAQRDPGLNRRLNIRRIEKADAARIIKGWK